MDTITAIVVITIITVITAMYVRAAYVVRKLNSKVHVQKHVIHDLTQLSLEVTAEAHRRERKLTQQFDLMAASFEALNLKHLELKAEHGQLQGELAAATLAHETLLSTHNLLWERASVLFAETLADESVENPMVQA